MASLGSYGSWALVTGASVGIGEAFSRALADAHVNVVLVARRESNLRALAAELQARCRIETRVLPTDLATEGAAERISAAVDDLEIGTLINNETEFQAVAGERAHPGAKPEDVVAAAVAALGRKPSVIVGASNKVRAWSVRLAPRSMTARAAAAVMRSFLPEAAR